MSPDPQIPEDVAALISAHALGALEPDQAALAEEHIAASDACRRAYEAALETAAALALAVADSEPPVELRNRILAAARAERAPVAKPAPARRSWNLGGLLTPSSGFAALGVAAAIAFALIAISQRDSANRASDRAEALAAIVSAQGARVVPLTGTSGSGRANLIVGSGRAALVSQLPQPPAGRTYQAWGLKPGTTPVPLPTFSHRGAVLILDSIGSYAQIGITVEPSGGSKQPSAAPFAVASL